MSGLKNGDGIWGPARPMSYDTWFSSPYNFRITGDKWISGAEYFIDVDPGTGQGMPVSPVDGEFDQAEEEFDFSGMDISYLGVGFHTLYLRLQDNEGTWGMAREIPFEIHEKSIISGAEYFIDEDPGPGSGIPLPAKDGLFDSLEEQIDFSAIDLTDVSEGVHTLYMRFMDQSGRWGARSSWPFGVNRPIASMNPDPVQPSTGDGRIPVVVNLFDHSKSPTCKLKVEYALDGTEDWHRITIEENSLSVSNGSLPVLDNGADYQIGGPVGWIDLSGGSNTVSCVWLSRNDLGLAETENVRFRYTIHNGTGVYVTSTVSGGVFVDNLAPDIPVLIPVFPDPTGDTTPELTWYPVSDAHHYHIQIAADSNFSELVYEAADNRSNSVTPQTSLPYANFFWRVKAVDASGNQSAFSSPDQFSLVPEDGPPGVTLNYSSESPVSAGPLTITAVFTEAISTIPQILIDHPGSGGMLQAENMEGSGTIWYYTYTVACSDGNAFMDGTAGVTISNGFDSSGNENQPAQNNTFDIDTGQCGTGRIIAAEYYFDKDPGQGRGCSCFAGRRHV